MSIAIEIATEIARLQTAKQDIKTAIENKGVTVPAGTLLSGFAPLIDNITTGEGGNGGEGLQIITGQVPPEILHQGSGFTITGLPSNPIMVYIFHNMSETFDVTQTPTGMLFYVRTEETTMGSNVISACPAYSMSDPIMSHWEYENGSLILGAYDAGVFWALWYEGLPVYYIMVV